ncbi:MAG: hypothetical protein Q9196_001421, partial [Gyalolechia fulgens]
MAWFIAGTEHTTGGDANQQPENPLATSGNTAGDEDEARTEDEKEWISDPWYAGIVKYKKAACERATREVTEAKLTATSRTGQRLDAQVEDFLALVRIFTSGSTRF